ncbi:MAG: hypothetical protein WD872_11570 [Pirellulaceae bacterium]
MIRFGSLSLVLTMLGGCTRQADVQPAAISEPTLAAQIAAVERGQSTRIQVETQALSDQDLQQLAKLDGLEELLIDRPAGQVTAAGLSHLTGLPHLSHLRIRGGGVDDAALAEIAKLPGLRILNVPRGEFTDAGLRQLKPLTELQQLRFGSSQVTDAGIQAVGELPAIKQLHLIDVPFTDQGLASIAEIEQLESLYIDGTPLSDAAWSEFFRTREKLGRVHVHLDQQHHDRDPHQHAH